MKECSLCEREKGEVARVKCGACGKTYRGVVCVGCAEKYETQRWCEQLEERHTHVVLAGSGASL